MNRKWFLELVHLSSISALSPIRQSALGHILSRDGPVAMQRAILKSGLIKTAVVEQLVRVDRLEIARAKLKDCSELGISAIPRGDPAYPKLLMQCPDAPVVLYLRSRPEMLDSNLKVLNSGRWLSVVGARKATPHGLAAVRQLLQGLCAAPPLSFASGLAFGVDAALHEHCLNLNLHTAAVLAHGLEEANPAGNRALAHRILDQGGCWLSEFPPGQKAFPRLFPRRNRIMAGMNLGTVLVEAEKRSGSLITAKLAHSYDRQVWAMPGAWDAPMSSGCNHLIRTHIAAILEKPAQILEDLGIDGSAETQPPLCLPEGELGSLLKAASIMATFQLEDLQPWATANRIAAGQLAAILGGAELEGWILKQSDGQYRIAESLGQAFK